MNISDHALVRFIERYKGMSLEAYREEMRAMINGAPRLRRQDLPDGHDDGMLFVIEMNETIVTVLGHGFRPKKARKWDSGRFVYIPAKNIG